eukprot:2361082-Lingulodinium_polyedra.AAC.1
MPVVCPKGAFGVEEAPTRMPEDEVSRRRPEGPLSDPGRWRGIFKSGANANADGARVMWWPELAQ